MEGGERAGAGGRGAGGAAGGQGEVGAENAQRGVPGGGVRRGGRRGGEGDAERARGGVGDEAGGRRPGAHVEGPQRRVRVGVGALAVVSFIDRVWMVAYAVQFQKVSRHVCVIFHDMGLGFVFVCLCA